MNRGCFIGPYLPIYSVVGVLNIYLLADVESSVKIVVIASLTCCAVEYVTSYTLEKIFHARYWDYSYFPLNINGRVSVVSGLFFGFAILLLLKVLHPFTLQMVGRMTPKVRLIACIVFLSVFIVDMILTTIGMCNLNRKCKEIYDSIDGYWDEKFDRLNSKKDYFTKFKVVKKGQDLIVKMKGANRKFVEMETRFLKVYPDFRSTLYPELIEKMKYTIKKDKNLDQEDEYEEGFDDYKRDVPGEETVSNETVQSQ